MKWNSLVLLTAALLLTQGSTIVRADSNLFPAGLPKNEWVEFAASGYGKPVTGVVYGKELRPVSGMPLGGIDTGCIDIESTGWYGYNTLFNFLVGVRPPANEPILGLSVDGRTWVLVSDKKGKVETPLPGSGIPALDYTPVYYDINLEGVDIADGIQYWGHYPIVDMRFETGAPVDVSMRAWCPFIPGDTAVSNTPGAVFELHLTNISGKRQKGCLAMNFPAYHNPQWQPEIDRETLRGRLNGVYVKSPYTRPQLFDTSWDNSYVLAAIDEPSIRHGGPLRNSGPAWARIARELPRPGSTETGASIACDFDLAAGQSKTVRFVLAWYAPNWRAAGTPLSYHTWSFRHMYAKRYAGAPEVASFLAENHESLLKRIIAWQEVIYNDPKLPGWLADQLINSLHLITECSVWGQSPGNGSLPIGWARPEDGVFGMNECPRGCAQIECLPCSYLGNIPLVYFFPECALSTLRAYKHYQYPDGQPAWIFGGGTAGTSPYDLASPTRGYQEVLNSACIVAMVNRFWIVSGDDAVLREFYDMCRRATDFAFNLRPEYGLSQIVAMPTGDKGADWFEVDDPGWKGYVTHAGAVRMAQARMMRRMAEKMADSDYVKRMDAFLDAGAKAIEEHLWGGEYYLNFHKPETGEKSDLIFAYQFDGEFMARNNGVPSVFPRDRLRQNLDVIRRVNCNLSSSGAINYANPDGTLAKVGGYGTYAYFPPHVYMLGMTYMYEGQKEFGLELIHKCLKNMVCKWGYTWDMPNLMTGKNDSGERHFGADYYQNLMLWSVPAAIEGQDLSGPSRRGGLVERVIKAGTNRAEGPG
ncbi:MAG: hypothetical protein HYX78_04490 [Armatimonadetes bacterium]|nr:hypothetical protein [Armatimonadota bacterium]